MKSSPAQQTDGFLQSQSPVRQRLRWALRLAVPAGVLILGLGLGEAAVRVFDVGPQFHPVSKNLYRISNNPVLKYEHQPGAATGIDIINKAGYRGREVSLVKAKGVFRIACMGDSVTFGYGVREEETFPWHLEDLLNRYFGTDELSFEVINFGVIGYNLRQGVEALAAHVTAYDPDLAIYQYSLNDPELYSREFDRLTAELTTAHANYIERKIYSPSRFASRSRLYLLARYVWESNTYVGQTTGLRGPRDLFSFADMHHYVEHYSRIHLDRQMWSIVSDSLGLLVDLSARRRMPVCLVIFPIFKHLDDYKVKHLHDQVAAEARRQSLPVLDLLDGYRRLHQQQGGPFFVDSIHPNDRGYTFAAMVVLRKLLEDGLLPVADADFRRLAAPGEPHHDLATLAMEP